MNLNEIKLIGRVTKQPELKALPSGNTVVNFSLATNYTYKDKEGNKQEKATFHNIVCYGKRAEVIAQYVVKGQELYVSGRQEHRSWEKDDGTKGYMAEVILESFEFGQKPKGADGQSNDGWDDENNGDQTPPPNSESQEEEINPDDIPF